MPRAGKTIQKDIAALTLQGITVSIGNNGGEHDEILPGYLHGYVGDAVCSDGIHLYVTQCAIPVKADTEFCVHIGFEFAKGKNKPQPPMPNGILYAFVFFDGVFVADASCDVDSLKKIGQFEISGKQVGRDKVRPFCFSLRKSTEKDRTKGTAPDLYDLGSILVAVQWNREITPKSPADVAPYMPDQANPEELTNPVPEYAKGVQHEFVAHLGEAKHLSDTAVDETDGVTDGITVAPVNNKLFHFRFNYRSIEFLVAKKVAPRSAVAPGRYSFSDTPESKPKVKKERETPKPEQAESSSIRKSKRRRT